MQEYKLNKLLTAERQRELKARFSKLEQNSLTDIFVHIVSQHPKDNNNDIILFYAIIDIISSLPEDERQRVLNNYNMIYERCSSFDEIKAIENVLKYVVNSFDRINNNFYVSIPARKISSTFEIVANISLLSGGEERLNALNHLMHKNFGIGKPRVFNMLNDAPKVLYYLMKLLNDCGIYLKHPHNTSIELNVDKVVTAQHYAGIFENWRAKEIINILVICNSIEINKESLPYNYLQKEDSVYCVNDLFKLAKFLYSIRDENISLFKEIYGKWHYKNTESKLSSEVQEILIDSCSSNKNINSTIKSCEFFLEIEDLFKDRKVIDKNCINESIIWLSENNKNINADEIKSRVIEKKSFYEKAKIAREKSSGGCELSDLDEKNSEIPVM